MTYRNHVEAQVARSRRKRKPITIEKRGNVDVCQLTLSVCYPVEPISRAGRGYRCNYCGTWHTLYASPKRQTHD